MTKLSFSVYSAVLPLSICCSMFGFSTGDIGKVNRILQHVYSFIITVLSLIISTTTVVVTVCTMKVTFLSFLYTVSKTIIIVTITYYRLKFMWSGSVIMSALRNLDCVDKSLNAIGVTVSYVKYVVQFYVLLIFIVTTRAYLAYSFRNNVVSMGTFAPVFKSTFCFTVNMITFSSIATLEIYLFFIQCSLKKRLKTFHETLLYFNCLRYTAWSFSCSNACGRVGITERRSLCQKLYLIYTCLTQAYYNVKQFYTNFFCAKLIIMISFLSLHFHSPLSENNAFYFLAIMNLVIYETMPLWLCTSIKVELYNIHSLVYNVSFENRFSRIPTTLNNWIIRSANTDVQFDCGYFTVDVPLFSFVFDFVTLFVFAMIQ